MTDRDKLIELAERCEKATGPDRAIDADICELVELSLCVEPDCSPGTFREIIERARNGEETFGPDEECPLYTASIDAAMTLVPEGCGFTMVRTLKMDATARIFGENLDYGSFAKSPALALCAAALRAHTSKETNNVAD